jgi:hypothetical protein
MEQLRQQFPRAPAWGQAAFQDWGSVSTAVPEPTTDGGNLKTSSEEDVAAQHRPKRAARPNVKTSGPEWVK